MISCLTSVFLLSDFFFDVRNFRKNNQAFGEEIDLSVLSSVPKTYEEKYDSFLIIGTPEYLVAARSQLDMIRERDPVSWKKVKENITKISLTGKTATYVVDGRIEVCWKPGYSNEYSASQIVHEACHITQFKQGRYFSDEKAELECLKKQNNFLRKIGYETLDEFKTMKTRWWEVPYWDRNCE